MKETYKSCENCEYSKVYNEDKEYESVLEMLNDEENNFLTCTHTNHRKYINKKDYKTAKVEDNFICPLYKSSKGAVRDIRMMGGVLVDKKTI